MFAIGGIMGAPYLPTLKPTARAALDLAQLQPGDSLLDLGAGSGELLLAAAKRGINATGIEINPLLWLVAWLRLRPYRGRARIKWGNYWHGAWPKVDCIYIFLIGHQMERFARTLDEAERPLKVLSYTFEIPGLKAAKVARGIYYYELN
ncbi:MAG TPA: methyltransferase domain-containing protein [Candidatus Saccharimonadales bacterium]|nr:methyltransferase domain-containing protein [Candidatus Saccharimonadales bacterium]